MLRPRRWRRQVLPKRRLTFKSLHGVISRKTKLFLSCTIPTLLASYLFHLRICRSRDSSVGIETRLRAGRPSCRSPIPARESNVQTGSRILSPPYTMGNGRVTRLVREADHMPSSVKVKNVGATHELAICPHGLMLNSLSIHTYIFILLHSPYSRICKY
jgi:hypothetical protein